MKYNHNRSLCDFTDSVNKIRQKGFNPLYVTQMYFEDIFVFETNEEAIKAYEALNTKSDDDVIGFWYGLKQFQELVLEYELEGYLTVLIYKLYEKL